MSKTGKSYIQELIAQGENEHQDFKYQISDAMKIARSISAFANNSGGHLLVGVKDNGNIAGISSDEEIYMIETAAQHYCRPEQKVEFELFRVDGKNILKANIAEASVKPVKTLDDNGQWKAYYRVADENVLASSLHVKVLQHNSSAEAKVVMSYNEREKTLLDYLQNHGGITLNGYSRLAHISRGAAEDSVLNLCEIGIIELQYHDNKCLITLSDNPLDLKNDLDK